jgi:hypothetical protein
MSAASAAFHTHLARGREIGDLGPQEWDKASAVMKTQAGAYGLNHDDRRRAAWLGILLTGEFALLDTLREAGSLNQPAKVPLGRVLHGPDLLLLSEVADHWPALRAHFGQSLLDRLSGGYIRDTPGGAWEYLALVAARQPLLNSELENSLAADTGLLRHDGVLAWYATTHRNDSTVLDNLITGLDQGDYRNARSLASILLSDPWALRLDTDDLRRRLRDRIRPGIPSSSPQLEVLADAFPDDPAVRTCWQQLSHALNSGKTVGIQFRTYLPLVYAGVQASALVSQIADDMARLSARGVGYFDPQITRAVSRRIRRDAEGRAQIAAAVTDLSTPDTWATQLSTLLAAARSLDQDVTASLTMRYKRQHAAVLPDTIRDHVAAADLPVPISIFRTLDATGAETGIS